MATDSVACLDEPMLAQLVSGELDTAALQAVEAHLAGCADCRGVVADAAHGALDPALSQTRDGKGVWPQPGQVLADKYRIDGLLGRGGMGLVFAATHLELGHRVAIKVLDCEDPLATARFLREAKTCAGLLNEHIVRVFDLGRLPLGVPYFVMEHLRGRDLGSTIARERLPVALVVQYLLQVCAALKEAHAMGVIHRDLKPSNLFAVERSDGKPWIKVLDFGISKLVCTRPGQTPYSTLTTPDAVLGSPLYMSPEQIRGSKQVDARTDIWALGVIAYELLTRRRPFNGATLAAALIAIATEQPPRPSSLVPGLPAGLEALVLRCLEKQPDARFSSVDEVVDALGSFAQVASPARALSLPRPTLRRLPLPAALCLLGVLAWRLWSQSSLPAPRVEPVLTAAMASQPQQLNVHCDLPLPAGNVRLGASGVWPVERLCAAEPTYVQRLELLAVLADGTTNEQPLLEPVHPFYALRLERAPARLTLRLQRSARARIPLELVGAHCGAIAGVLVRAAMGEQLLGVAADAPGGGSCARELELRADDYGRRLAFQLEPRGYTASDVIFSGERIVVTVSPPQLRPTPVRRARAPQAHGEGPARDCLPPAEFCRK